MASGTFDKSVGKVRPGTYINFEDHDTSLVSGGTSGVVVIPFVNTDYGPAKSFIKITADALDAAKPYLGYSINDDDPAENMLLVREAFKGATTVIVYVCTEGTKAAAADGGGLTATALYKGARGNDLSYAVLEDPIGGFDVEVYLAGSKVEEFDGITSADAIASNYISFKSSGDLTEIAGVNLTGGTSATTENADVTAFLDALDAIAFNTICFPLTEQSLQASLKAKVKYIRENTFKKVQGVTANFDADYEGIINVTNAYALGSGDLTPAQATAYVAGITAGASNVESNTYRTVDGATGVVGLKSNDAAIEAIIVLKERFKTEYIVDVIGGNATNEVKSYKHHELEIFGTADGRDENFLTSVVRQGVLSGYIRKDIENYGVLKATEKGKKFLEHPEPFMVVEDKQFSDNDGEEHSGSSAVLDPALFSMLKDLRKEISQQMKLPPYVIFQDPSLEAMATTYPITLDELKLIPGVGEGKAKRYGQKFVELIKRHVDENEIERPEDFRMRAVASKSNVKIYLITGTDRKIGLDELAKDKGMDMDELLDELEAIVYSGYKINIGYYVDAVMDQDIHDDIYDYFRESESDDLQTAIDELGDDYTEEEIRLVRIQFLSDMGN